MTYAGIIFITFMISSVVGVLITGIIETLINRKKAYKRKLSQLQTENQRLKKVVNLYKFELETREVIK